MLNGSGSSMSTSYLSTDLGRANYIKVYQGAIINNDNHPCIQVKENIAII